MTFGEKVSDLMGWINRSLFDTEYVEEPSDVLFDDGADNYVTYPTNGPVAMQPEYSTRTRREDKKVVTSLNNYKEHEVKIIEPRSFGDTTQIVKQLLDNKTVVLNLHLLDKEQSQRTIDFICGAAFALGGAPQKVGDTVFVFTPKSVQLSVEAKEAAFGTESLWGGNL